MNAAGMGRSTIVRLRVAVALVCVIATVADYAIADAVSSEARAALNGFAAGALLVMLVDSMIPEASRDSGRVAGLITVLGFAVAAARSSAS